MQATIWKEHCQVCSTSDCIYIHVHVVISIMYNYVCVCRTSFETACELGMQYIRKMGCSSIVQTGVSHIIV